jgi:hypothetical protein
LQTVQHFFEAQGFVVRPVRALTLLNTLASNGADAPLSRQRLGAGGFDALAVTGGMPVAPAAPAPTITVSARCSFIRASVPDLRRPCRRPSLAA